MQRCVWAGVLVCAMAEIAMAQERIDRLLEPSPSASPTMLQVPTIFVENAGQFDAEVRFRTVMPWPSATVTDDGLVLTLLRRDDSRLAANARTDAGANTAVSQSTRHHDVEASSPLVGHNLRLRFVNAQGATNQHISPVGHESAPTRSSYFLGNDATRWVNDVATWQTVRLRDVSPGVSVDIHGRDGHLEYDLVVAPGATHDTTHVVIEGARSVRLLDDGSLDIDTPLGVVRQLPPVAWEVALDGTRVPITSRVGLLDGHRLVFHVTDRTPGRSLVIDPGLVYSTFLEGTGSETIEQGGLAVGDDGSTFVAGRTTSVDFPVTAGAFQLDMGSSSDIFVLGLAADAKFLHYATFMGGVSLDGVLRIVPLANGEVLGVGKTLSPDFPTTEGSYSQEYAGFDTGDGFAMRLSATGTDLIFSTLFSGTFTDLSVDALDRLVLLGMTYARISPSLRTPCNPQSRRI